MRAPVMAVVVACAGCISAGSAPAVKGAPGDVRTSPGTYVGYEVVRPCRDVAGDIGVNGRGKLAQRSDAVTEELALALKGVESVWTVGYGPGCRQGTATTVFIDDWRVIDLVIARTGAFLARRDLSHQVSIRVTSAPMIL